MGVCRENGGCTHYERGALQNLVRVCVCVWGGGERKPFKISLGEGLKSKYWGACGGLPREGKISCEGLHRSLWAEKYYFAAKFETQLN